MRKPYETPNCTITEETSTQSFVDSLLATNVKNRPINEVRVSQLCRDLQNGTWKFNGATIVVDGDGYLRDGQHRLTAIKRCGYPPIPLLVVHLKDTSENAERAYLTMDTGKTRSYCDALAHQGVKNGGIIGSIVNMLYHIGTGSWYANRSEMEAVRAMYGKAISAVIEKHNSGTGMFKYQTAYLAAFVLAAHITGRTEQICEFMDCVRKGIELRQGTNAYRLFAYINGRRGMITARPNQVENFGRTFRIVMAELGGTRIGNMPIQSFQRTAICTSVRELADRSNIDLYGAFAA